MILFGIKSDIKKEFGSKPVYKTPKVYSNQTCLAIIIFDSALKKDFNCYPQVFFKECKYIEKKVIRHINDNLSDFSSSDESYKE